MVRRVEEERRREKIRMERRRKRELRALASKKDQSLDLKYQKLSKRRDVVMKKSEVILEKRSSMDEEALVEMLKRERQLREEGKLDLKIGWKSLVDDKRRKHVIKEMIGEKRRFWVGRERTRKEGGFDCDKLID